MSISLRAIEVVNADSPEEAETRPAAVSRHAHLSHLVELQLIALLDH